MGSLILCHKKRAKRPFEISRVHMRIYTIEELCYYICNNLYLIDYTIVNERLCRWVGDELELPKLAEEYPGTFFLDDRHRSRMEFLNTQLGYVPGRNTPAYYAAMYLLTSNEIIYWRMANCFCRNGLDFRYAILRGITTYNYALYRAALALTTDRQGVTVSELDDSELIEDEVFRLIINAMLITRYGMTAMKLTKEASANDG